MQICYTNKPASDFMNQFFVLDGNSILMITFNTGDLHYAIPHFPEITPETHLVFSY